MIFILTVNDVSVVSNLGLLSVSVSNAGISDRNAAFCFSLFYDKRFICISQFYQFCGICGSVNVALCPPNLEHKKFYQLQLSPFFMFINEPIFISSCQMKTLSSCCMKTGTKFCSDYILA